MHCVIFSKIYIHHIFVLLQNSLPSGRKEQGKKYIALWFCQVYMHLFPQILVSSNVFYKLQKDMVALGMISSRSRSPSVHSCGIRVEAIKKPQKTHRHISRSANLSQTSLKAIDSPSLCHLKVKIKEILNNFFYSILLGEKYPYGKFENQKLAGKFYSVPAYPFCLPLFCSLGIY